MENKHLVLFCQKALYVLFISEKELTGHAIQYRISPIKHRMQYRVGFRFTINSSLELILTRQVTQPNAKDAFAA
jgi:hypothetical protein